MSGSAASVAYLILATFLGGVTLGVVAMVAIAVKREDRLYSLSGAAPGAPCLSALSTDMATTAMIPTRIPMMKKAPTMATTVSFTATSSRVAGNESLRRRSG